MNRHPIRLAATVVGAVGLLLGACTDQEKTKSAADPTTSSTASEGPTPPSPPVPTVDDRIGISGSKAAIQFLSHPNARASHAVMSEAGDVALLWVLVERSCRWPVVVTWVPRAYWLQTGGTPSRVKGWLLSPGTQIEAGQEGFVLSEGFECRAAARYEKDTRAWYLGRAGLLARVAHRTSGEADRAGHLSIPCQVGGSSTTCEVDADSKSMWPIGSQADWTGAWEPRTSLLTRSTLPSVGVDDWSIDNGRTWQQVPETLDVSVVRYGDRVARVSNTGGGCDQSHDGGRSWAVGCRDHRRFGYVSWQVTDSGRLFGQGKNFFLISDDQTWQRVSKQRLPRGPGYAQLAGNYVYAFAGNKLMINQDFDRVYEGYLDAQMLKPLSEE